MKYKNEYTIRYKHSPKYTSTDASSYVVLSDIESEYENFNPCEKINNKSHAKNINAITKKRSSGSIEILNIKHIPTIFFIAFIITIGMISFKFFPIFYKNVKEQNLYSIKFHIEYVSQFFSQEQQTLKVKIF
jgi:hypothetical protein